MVSNHLLIAVVLCSVLGWMGSGSARSVVLPGVNQNYALTGLPSNQTHQLELDVSKVAPSSDGKIQLTLITEVNDAQNAEVVLQCDSGCLGVTVLSSKRDISTLEVDIARIPAGKRLVLPIRLAPVSHEVLAFDYQRLNETDREANLAVMQARLDRWKARGVDVTVNVSTVGLHYISAFHSIPVSAALSVALIVVCLAALYFLLGSSDFAIGMLPSDFVFVWVKVLSALFGGQSAVAEEKPKTAKKGNKKD